MFFKLLSGELVSIEFPAVASIAEVQKQANRYFGASVTMMTEAEELSNDEIINILIQDLPIVHKKFYIAGKLYRRVINDYSQEPEEWYNSWDGEEDRYTEEDTFSFVSDILDFIPLSRENVTLSRFLRMALVDPLSDDLMPYFFGSDRAEQFSPVEWQLKLKKTVKHA
jgi:hypothetical protein